LEPLEAGGMGEVFLAQHIETGHPVAIKFPKPELVASPEGQAAFRHEITAASRLIHRNIARVHTRGQHAGRAYFVMDLLARGTLADARNRACYREPEPVRELMLKIARAVQFAHSHMTLHCDLKPANILFDEDREPHVADFGLARIVDASGVARSSVLDGATPGWHAPEQEQKLPLSVETDVYNLGLLLRWLLSGAETSSTEEIPTHPPTWEPTLGWALEAISWRALRARRTDRYRSAGEFADELERAGKGLAIAAERQTTRRVIKWARRNRISSLACLALALLALCVPFMPFAVVEEVRTTIKNQNAFSAVAQAGAVMNELRAVALRVDTMSRDPTIVALVRHQNLATTPAVLAAYGRDFDSASVFSADGTHSARWPRPPDPKVSPNCAFRDYFRCSVRVMQELAKRSRSRQVGSNLPVCVSRPHRSLWDGELKLGVSAPLFERGVFVGVVEGSIKARHRFGAVRMDCGRGECWTALLGARDRDRPEDPLPRTLTILAQPGLSQGEQRLLRQPTTRRICDSIGCEPLPIAQFEPKSNAEPLLLDDYVDPLSNTHAITAVAPVGGTGLSVLVATPKSAEAAARERMAGAIKRYLWIPFGSALLLWGALMSGPGVRAWLSRQRRCAPRNDRVRDV
jgi:serine/threonine protein kinase